MSEEDRDYHLQRAAAEQKLAREASTPSSRSIHSRLAELHQHCARTATAPQEQG